MEIPHMNQFAPVLRIRIRIRDPDPPDPRVLGPPGSGSISQRYKDPVPDPGLDPSIIKQK